MDHMDVLHLVANLSRILGEKHLLEELELIGWRGITHHPVEFFQGYLSVFKDQWDYHDKIATLKNDITGIANLHGFDIVGDEIVDIVPR